MAISLRSKTCWLNAFAFLLLLTNSSMGASASASGHSAGASPSGQLIPDQGEGLVQATATTDEKNASVTATFNLPPPSINPFGGASRQLLSFIAQTPVGQGANYTNVSTLDGLIKSTAISASYMFLGGGFNQQATGADYANDMAFQQKCWELVHKADPTQAQDGICDSAIMSPAIAKASPGEQSALQAMADNLWQDETNRLPEPIWMLSLNGKIGYEQHTYYDPTSLAKSTENRTPYQLGLQGTFVSKNGDHSINLSFNYQRAYQDANMGTTQTKCRVAVSPAVTCVTGFIGAPTQKDKALLGVDYRYIGTLPLVGLPFGINPGFTYDADAHAKAVQFPIYLMTDASKNLTGGIRYDWTSTNHVSTVGLFVSAAFSVLSGGPS